LFKGEIGFGDFAEEGGGVAAGVEEEAEFEVGPEVVGAGGDGVVFGLKAQGSASAFDVVCARGAEVVKGKVLLGEDVGFDPAGFSGWLGHAVSEEGARGGYLEVIASGLLDGEVFDAEDGPAGVSVGQVADFESIESPNPVGDNFVEEK